MRFTAFDVQLFYLSQLLLTLYMCLFVPHLILNLCLGAGNHQVFRWHIIHGTSKQVWDLSTQDHFTIQYLETEIAHYYEYGNI